VSNNCQHCFSFQLPSVLWSRRVKNSIWTAVTDSFLICLQHNPLYCILALLIMFCAILILLLRVMCNVSDVDRVWLLLKFQAITDMHISKHCRVSYFSSSATLSFNLFLFHKENPIVSSKRTVRDRNVLQLSLSVSEIIWLKLALRWNNDFEIMCVTAVDDVGVQRLQIKRYTHRSQRPTCHYQHNSDLPVSGNYSLQ